MPQMLTLSNGRPETILSPKDFEDLIDKHMGMDCANYYQNQIEQLSELIRDLDSYEDILMWTIKTFTRPSRRC